MVFATSSCAIHAPVALVWAKLLEKVVSPQLTIPGVEEVRIVERPSEDVFVREMRTTAFFVKERITVDTAAHHITFVRVDDPDYEGYVDNSVTEAAGGGSLLTYTLDWTPRGGAPDIEGGGMLQAAVEGMKRLCEEHAA
jgi:hypothetical protein